MIERRAFLGGLGALVACGCTAARGGKSRKNYSVAVLGDTHFDAEPDSVYHAHYKNEGKAEWLWKVQRQEFARNGEMWRERCRRMLAASARVAGEKSTDFVLQLGDLIQGDCDDVATHRKMLDDCIKMLRAPYPKGMPFLTVVGNHDFRGEGAVRAYFDFIEPFLAKEIGQAVKYPAFSFWHGPDLWIFCHFEQACPADLIPHLEEGLSARHVFLISHGPFTPSESTSWHWRLGGDEGLWGAERAKVIDLLLRRHVIVLSGHTHQINYWRIANARGAYSEFTVNSVWAKIELATASPVTEDPARYGEATLAAFRANKDARNAEAYARDIAPFKADLKNYAFIRGAGHFRLNVGEEKVTMDYFPGDAREPAKTFVMKED